jgi:hypothetical protein
VNATTKQQNTDGTWSEAKPLPYYYHRPTLRIRLGDALRWLANKVAGKYWRCSTCGWIDHMEKEVLCWKCGQGEMIYQGDGPEFD